MVENRPQIVRKNPSYLPAPLSRSSVTWGDRSLELSHRVRQCGRVTQSGAQTTTAREYRTEVVGGAGRSGTIQNGSLSNSTGDIRRGRSRLRWHARRETVSASASLPHRMSTLAGCSMRQDPGGDVRFNATDNTTPHPRGASAVDRTAPPGRSGDDRHRAGAADVVTGRSADAANGPARWTTPRCSACA